MAGTDGSRSAVHRLSAQAAQHPKAFALFRGQIGTEAGQVAGEIGCPGVRPVGAKPQPSGQLGHGVLCFVPGRDAKFPTLCREFLLLLQSRRLDVVGDEIQAGGRDQQRDLAVGGRRVHVRRCAARGPGETAHAPKEKRVEFALR